MLRGDIKSDDFVAHYRYHAHDALRPVNFIKVIFARLYPELAQVSSVGSSDGETCA